MTDNAPRDLRGYGVGQPVVTWPGSARIAVQIVLNYEEGGERSPLYGDPASETFLSDLPDPIAFPNRHMSIESLFEYGSRVGVWRILDALKERELQVTVFGVASALAANPDVIPRMLEDGHEIACHGLRWLSYQEVDAEVERQHLQEAVALHTELVGSPPVGWYTGRDSPVTRQLVVEHGGFLYDSDSYNDDLPYWTDIGGASHLVVPYALDTNDLRYVTSNGVGGASSFSAYLIDSFDVLYREGLRRPKMMSVGLHCRLTGRPGRLPGLLRFLDHVAKFSSEVWICRRRDIAEHWISNHSPGVS